MKQYKDQEKNDSHFFFFFSTKTTQKSIRDAGEHFWEMIFDIL